MGVGVGVGKLVAMIIVIAALGSAQGQSGPEFKCSATNATCRALVEYKNQNATTLRYIQTLFNVKHLQDILGANNLPYNTSGNYSVDPNKAIKVPIPCKCSNNTGLSNHVPIYTIKPGDGLYDIATTVFAGLVKYPQIQVANNISDANKIIAGDKIWIPLPCSCDEVDGVGVVHYAYIVEMGSSVDLIAQEFGTTPETLLSLNGIQDPKSLNASQVLDVPLKACSSSVRNDSLDFPLLVANATYIYTANNCVKCNCDSNNNYTLQCEPSQLKPTNWSVCPSMKCQSNVYISNTTSTDACSQTTCDYAGYTSNNISTVLANHSTCAAAPSGSGASRSTLQGWVWRNLFIVIHFILFSVYLL